MQNKTTILENIPLKTVIQDATRANNNNSDLTTSEVGLVQLNDKERAELERFKGDTTLKKWLTIFVIGFTSIWSIVIIYLLYKYGKGKLYYSDAILIALITETLFLVLGLPSIVTMHFFPQNKP